VCGIAGVFNRDGRPVEQAWLLAMADTLCHRGPDADGFWAADGLGLAHRRLSVIDVSDAGRQPMGSEDGRIQVQPVFCLLKATLLESLVQYLHEGGRKIDRWTALHRCVQVAFDDAQAFFNANTLDELQRLQGR